MQTQKLATQLYSQYPAPSMLLQTTNMPTCLSRLRPSSKWPSRLTRWPSKLTRWPCVGLHGDRLSLHGNHVGLHGDHVAYVVTVWNFEFCYKRRAIRTRGVWLRRDIVGIIMILDQIICGSIRIYILVVLDIRSVQRSGNRTLYAGLEVRQSILYNIAWPRPNPYPNCS